MMHSWQALFLIFTIPLLILSILSFLGHLIRLLPCVFLIVFGFGGIAVLLDISNQGIFLGTVELIVGGLLTLISAINLYLMVSNHRHDVTTLKSRHPRTPIRNIILDKLEKPNFGNPNVKQSSAHKSSAHQLNSQQNKSSKRSKPKHLASLSPKPSKRSSQF